MLFRSTIEVNNSVVVGTPTNEFTRTFDHELAVIGGDGGVTALGTNYIIILGVKFYAHNVGGTLTFTTTP